MFDSRDNIILIALSGEVLLALVMAMVVVPHSPVVIVAAGEEVTFLVPLVGPSLHHVGELYDSLGVAAAKVTIEVQLGEAILEAVDYILVEYVHDGGTGVQETPRKTSRSHSAATCIGISHVVYLHRNSFGSDTPSYSRRMAGLKCRGQGTSSRSSDSGDLGPWVYRPR